MKTSTAQIVATATDHAADITRVISASVDTMKTAAAICSNALRSAMSTKNADRLTEIAGNAIAAASAASDANMKAWRDIEFANAEYVSKARRSAAAFAAAATRAAATGDAAKIEAAEAKRDAAAQAVQIVEEAYRAADAARIEGNRAMNAAMDDARAIVNRAKEVAAANRAREIVDRYPETDAETIAETVARELESRFKDINKAAQEVFRMSIISDRRAARAAANAALLSEAERAEAAERAEISRRMKTTRTRHMNIGEKKAQAHTVGNPTEWSAEVYYQPVISNRRCQEWRVDVYRAGVYFCRDSFYTIEEAEEYAEAMTDPDEITAEAMNKANEAMSEASEAMRKAIEAAINYNPEAAAAHAQEAEQAAQKAEQAANKAWSAATTPATCEAADIASEDAASARAYADRATETAKQSMIEADADAAARAAMSGTAPAEATKNAAHWADLAEQAAQQVAEAATICDADAYDNRAAMYAAAAIDEAARYDADDATDVETARAISAAAQARENLISRVNRGMTEADAEAVESSDYAATLTSEAFAKAGTNPAEARAEADRAARAFLQAYEIATGESIATSDPLAAAAQRVARLDIAHEAGSTAQDRFLVDEMVSDIADEWARTAWYREEQRETAAARAAFATQAAPDLAKYDELEFLELEPAPAPMYQRFELEAYIGAENLEDYDVDAIEEEATEYDPATSRTVWKRGIDLATICERHEIAAYYPAAV